MLLVKVAGVSFSNVGFVVLLRGEADRRTLPIFVGAAEAQAIAIRLDRVEVPRPLTHDLFKNVLDCLECRLKRVVVCDLVENTFYAVLVLERDGTEVEIDARPSDAIALALRFGAPIYVVEKVMEHAGVVLEEEKPKAKSGTGNAGRAEVKTASPLAVLKQQLEEAIRAERYEEAARLRDEIKRLEESHTKN